MFGLALRNQDVGVKPQDYGGKHMFRAPLHCRSHPLSAISKRSFHLGWIF